MRDWVEDRLLAALVAIGRAYNWAVGLIDSACEERDRRLIDAGYDRAAGALLRGATVPDVQEDVRWHRDQERFLEVIGMQDAIERHLRIERELASTRIRAALWQERRRVYEAND